MYVAKPGVDWHAIRERYERGEAANAIAKDHDVSKQGIAKRAVKERWGKPEVLTLNTPQWLPLTTDLTDLAEHSLYTPERCAKALDAISQGANHTVAAALIGIHRETWRKWREASPALQAAVELAQATQALDALQSIGKSSKTDWRAAERILAGNPLTKEDWKQQDAKGGVQVTINVQRAKIEDMIDITP